MKKGLLIALMSGFVLTASAQHDDMYFVPKKKKVQAEAVAESKTQEDAAHADTKTVSVTTFSANGLDMDEDTYNRRGSYLTESGDAVSALATSNEGFVLITAEGDTLWMNTDTLRLAHISEGEGWVNGFDGSESDYEYAMRIVRFRNPRYAIPVSSPLYWDVVYGSALWPSWEWNIYDDGMYAYVFPTSSNWYYSDYMMGHYYGWGGYGYYPHHYPHYGSYWGWSCYGGIWYDPWFNPYLHGYNGWYPAWHVGHHHGPHHGYYPGMGVGKPGWGGGTPAPRPIRNDRQASVPASRRGTQDNLSAGRGTTSASRQGTTSSASRTEATGASRSSSVRVITGDRTGVSPSGAVRSSSPRTGSEEVIRRGSSTSSTMSRGSATGTSSRSSAGSSYNRPSSTRSSSSSVSRSSSSSSSSSVSRSSSSSSSSRSSSYSGSSSSYSGSSYSSSSRSSSYSGGGSSYSGGSSRSGSSYSGGSSRSGSSYSGSRR